MKQLDNCINSYKFCTLVFIAMLSALTTLISVGFGALNQNLNISGDIDYEVDGNFLYNVLKKEARIGTYAKEYTGNHHDSYTEEPSKSIYYWYANSDSNASIILDKWNVIFGGFCWQMIRTTDTGGVKMIYNGTPNDGACTRTGTGQQIGTSPVNSDNSLAYVGYMYNTRYTTYSKGGTFTSVLSSSSASSSSNYYYGTGVTYDFSTNKYTLTGVTQNTWSNTYSSCAGLYVCSSLTGTTCTNVYYLVGGDSSNMYGFLMSEGNLLNYYDTNIKFGTGYTVNNGVYTLTGVTTIAKKDWYSNYSSYSDYYTCGDDSSSCTTINKIIDTKQYNYFSISSDLDYVYANGFSYDSVNDVYTLSNDRFQVWDLVDDVNKTKINTHHYTCFNLSGECSTLYYIHDITNAYGYNHIFYVELKNGKSIEDAKNEMLYADNVNQNNSILKTYIDNWYSNNMTSYTSYLEDTIFCNRRYVEYNTNGWNPNGGSVFQYVSFYSPSLGALECPYDTDKFSVGNDKAKLLYPVGLATNGEMSLLSHANLVKTGQTYWLMTPDYFQPNGGYVHAYMDNVYSNGRLNVHVSLNSSRGVRPVVSLKPGIEYISGEGSKTDPYIVE